MKNIVFYSCLAIIIIMHSVGLYGILYGHRSYFIKLTWVNLVVTGLCFITWALVEHRKKLLPYLIGFLIVGLAGFFIEVLGVHSRKIFGVYAYGLTLGHRVWNVPLIIGLNWSLLVFSVAAITSHLYQNFWIKTAIGASVLTALDYLIEPMAVYFGYWTWSSATIPLQNFLAWWIVSFLMLAFCFAFVKNIHNRLGVWIYGLQLVFFTLLNLLLK